MGDASLACWYCGVAMSSVREDRACTVRRDSEKEVYRKKTGEVRFVIPAYRCIAAYNVPAGGIRVPA